MAALDGMRGVQPALSHGQRTLPSMFVGQAAAPSPVQASPSQQAQALAVYDISDAQTMDPSTAAANGGGEKRKLEQISAELHADDGSSCTGDEKPMEVVQVVAAVAPTFDGAWRSQSQGEHAEVHAPEMAYSKDPRDALRHRSHGAERSSGQSRSRKIGEAIYTVCQVSLADPIPQTQGT